MFVVAGFRGLRLIAVIMACIDNNMLHVHIYIYVNIYMYIRKYDGGFGAMSLSPVLRAMGSIFCHGWLSTRSCILQRV